MAWNDFYEGNKNHNVKEKNWEKSLSIDAPDRPVWKEYWADTKGCEWVKMGALEYLHMLLNYRWLRFPYRTTSVSTIEDWYNEWHRYS